MKSIPNECRIPVDAFTINVFDYEAKLKGSQHVDGMVNGKEELKRTLCDMIDKLDSFEIKVKSADIYNDDWEEDTDEEQ